MSADSRPEWAEEADASLAGFPSFDLAFLFDEDEHPSEVTVYVDDAKKLATNWMTVDIEHAVSLEEVR
ncbi:MAG: hypothetical protein ABEJ28_07720 [Salinigranum sp.]